MDFKKILDLKGTLIENSKNFELAHNVDAIYHFLWDDYADCM
jgi:hypothetical protein